MTTMITMMLVLVVLVKVMLVVAKIVVMIIVVVMMLVEDGNARTGIVNGSGNGDDVNCCDDYKCNVP
jgi:hypothetical protein